MFTRSEVIMLTNKHTNTRRRWKHPTLFATLRRWVIDAKWLYLFLFTWRLVADKQVYDMAGLCYVISKTARGSLASPLLLTPVVMCTADDTMLKIPRSFRDHISVKMCTVVLKNIASLPYAPAINTKRRSMVLSRSCLSVCVSHVLAITENCESKAGATYVLRCPESDYILLTLDWDPWHWKLKMTAADKARFPNRHSLVISYLHQVLFVKTQKNVSASVDYVS